MVSGTVYCWKQSVNVPQTAAERVANPISTNPLCGVRVGKIAKVIAVNLNTVYPSVSVRFPVRTRYTTHSHHATPTVRNETYPKTC